MSIDTDSKRSFVLQFSWCKVPEHETMHDEEGMPNGQLALDLGNQLASRGPMLSCVFFTAKDEVPTVSQLHKAVQSEYLNIHDESKNETYGLLLDTLRRIHINMLELEQMSDEDKEIAASSYTAPIGLPLNHGALIASDELVCMLYMSPIRSFLV